MKAALYYLLVAALIALCASALACQPGANLDPKDDSVWVVSCHSTENGDWFLDSTGKVHSDDTKALEKAARSSAVSFAELYIQNPGGSPLGTDLKPGDTIHISGIPFTVTAVNKTNPSNINVRLQSNVPESVRNKPSSWWEQ